MRTKAKKQPTKLVAIRLPLDIRTWIDRRSSTVGKTKTRIVIESLRAKMLLKEAA